MFVADRIRVEQASSPVSPYPEFLNIL